MTPIREVLANERQKFRVEAGWQCPECYGVRISNRADHILGPHIRNGWCCDECGCQWGAQR